MCFRAKTELFLYKNTAAPTKINKNISMGYLVAMLNFIHHTSADQIALTHANMDSDYHTITLFLLRSQ